jgi:hypothetical protein
MAKGQKTGGRKAGTPNKTTAQVKEALTSVYTKKGGDSALLNWARANETEFYKLWGRMLPQEVTGEGGGPMSLQVVTGVPRDGGN